MPQNRSPKVKGEQAEVCFLYKAIMKGLTVSKPYGDNARYDFIVDGSAGIFRVQVRSSGFRKLKKPSYSVVTSNGRSGKKHKRYTAEEIDILAAYIVPADTWYILPVRAFAPASAVSLYPRHGLGPSRVRFERFREAWQLFTAEPELTIP